MAYYDDIKQVNEKIDSGDYDAARARANLLKDKYPDLIATKLANLDRIESLRKRCFERVNSGAVKVSMEDVSRRYAYGGDIQEANEKGLNAKMLKKGWDAFTKEEIGRFYAAVIARSEATKQSHDEIATGRQVGPRDDKVEDFIALAAFLMEGVVAADFSLRLDQALDMLGKAKGLGADVSAHLKYIETLKQAQKEFAEAEAKGKALETAETAKPALSKVEGAPSTPRTETQGEEKTKEKPLAPLVNLAVKSFDDVYVTTAATGDKIPHPLSRKTNTVIVGNQRIKVPEGMVYVPAGEFLMGAGKEPPSGPEHKVYLDAYFIGKYEVTNAEYMEFVKATGRPMPAHWVANSRNMPEGIENHPVYRVSWEDAKAYCDWCGKRLPTEAEWEKAATWDMKRRAKRVCPWGDDLDPRMANNCYQTGCRCNGDSKVHSQWRGKWSKSEEGKKILALGGNTSPVGGVKGDRSFFNCFDMAGNVREWIADWYGADYYTVSPSKNPTGPSAEEATLVNYYSIKNEKCRVARGVFWFEYFKGWRGSLRYFAIPTERGSGFRCAADYPWEPTEKAEGEKERRGEGATGRGGETAETAKPPTQSSALSPQSYDDVYVTAAATGEKIPHPLSKKTYNLRYLGRTIKGPEGMVYVPAGTFTMGEGESEHKVYLDAYFIGKYEVTNAEWKAFLDATEYKVLPSHWKGRDFPQGTDAHPVAYVAWVDAHMYCDWVSTETGRVVRLPTEAQWEKAARGPKGFTYPWGNNWDPKLCNGPWLCASKCGLKVNPDGSVPQWDAFVKSEKWKEVGAAGGYTTAIGSYPQGKSFYGCHDLAGNVFEWCADWSKTDYYKLKDAKKNPQGPDEEDAELCEFSGRKSKARLTRGGSWQHEASFCRSISRCRDLPTRRSNSLGFRVVVLPSGTP